MANEPLRRTPPRPAPPEPDARPRIWAEGGQRPPFVVRAFGWAGLFLTREAVAPLAAWSARTARRVAVNVRDGAGRIPEARLGRMARFVPSHLRVAGWIKTFAAILAHASANADPDARRGNALVAEIEPHLWAAPAAVPPAPADPAPADPAAAGLAAAGLAAAKPVPADPAPVVLPEPSLPEDDPLAAIRDDLNSQPAPDHRGRPWVATASGPVQPPAPPGPVGTVAIQVAGYVLGWAAVILALPYGLARALWLWLKGTDLRGIGQDG